MADNTETVVQRQRREAAKYAAANAPLHACNTVAHAEDAAMRSRTNEAARVAINAVAAAFGSAPDATIIETKKGK